jgi:DNA-binding MarR family transcriptional regulator
VSSDALEFGDVLARVSRRVKVAASEALREVGVHAGQNFLIDELAHEDALTPGELARRIGVEVSTMTRATQRMEATGLVHRVPDARDARLVQVALTPEGRAIAEQLPAILGRVYDQALADLTTAERKTLVDLLRRIVPT